MASRLSRVLGISGEAIEIYQPLILPLGLQLAGFLMLSLGRSPKRADPNAEAQAEALQEGGGEAETEKAR